MRLVAAVVGCCCCCDKGQHLRSVVLEAEKAFKVSQESQPLMLRTSAYCKKCRFSCSG